MIEARAEITLKFSGKLPEAKPAPDKKVEVQLIDQNGLTFTALINAKSWRKAEASATVFESWAGVISGKLGQQKGDGFEVLEAGIQIFEKRAKEPKPEAVAIAVDSIPIL